MQVPPPPLHRLRVVIVDKTPRPKKSSSTRLRAKISMQHRSADGIRVIPHVVLAILPAERACCAVFTRRFTLAMTPKRAGSRREKNCAADATTGVSMALSRRKMRDSASTDSRAATVADAQDWPRCARPVLFSARDQKRSSRKGTKKIRQSGSATRSISRRRTIFWSSIGSFAG